ncbi:MAG: polysaccharide pyruvyl transferase family protein [Candidatus Helarchaeota archaeon]
MQKKFSIITFILLRKIFSKYFVLKPRKLLIFSAGCEDLSQVEIILFDRQNNISYKLGKIITNPLFSKINEIEVLDNKFFLSNENLKSIQYVLNSITKVKTIKFWITNNQLIKVLESIDLILRNIPKDVHTFSNIIISANHLNEYPNLGFDSDLVLEQLAKFNNKGFKISIHFPITTVNCNYVDDLLGWCKNNGIQKWNFFFTSQESEEAINNFSSEQLFHLSMFFEKLSRSSSLDILKRIYYKDLSEKLGNDIKSIISYDFQDGSTVFLNTEGDVFFCPNEKALTSLQSKLGSTCHNIVIYQEWLKKKHHWYKNNPENSLSKILVKRIFKKGKNIVTNYTKKVTKPAYQKQKASAKIKPSRFNSPDEWRRVLITGWYGTETTGDKAILGELLHFIKQYSPECKILITTINEKISKQTNKELDDLANAEHINIACAHKSQIIDSVDAVIMGGGPLMETSAMEHVWRIFKEANRQHKARVIFGCGIGPLHSDHITWLTSQVLNYSTAGFFRDEESYQFAKRLAPDNLFEVACDPSLGFLTRWIEKNAVSITKPRDSLRIATLLRKNTREFVVDQNKRGLEDLNMQFAVNIAGALENVCLSYEGTALLLAMNAPWIGGDDRIFNRVVASNFKDQRKMELYRQYMPLNDLLCVLSSADIAVPMRYHGHLFSMALGIPFLSIDYSGKAGKVQNFIRRIDYEQWSVRWPDLDPKNIEFLIQQLYEKRDYWSVHLKNETIRLVNDLQGVYQKLFEAC